MFYSLLWLFISVMSLIRRTEIFSFLAIGDNDEYSLIQAQQSLGIWDNLGYLEDYVQYYSNLRLRVCLFLRQLLSLKSSILPGLQIDRMGIIN